MGVVGTSCPSASGLVVKSNVAIVGPRVRFSAGALVLSSCGATFRHDVGGYHTCLSRRIPGFESPCRKERFWALPPSALPTPTSHSSHHPGVEGFGLGAVLSGNGRHSFNAQCRALYQRKKERTKSKLSFRSTITTTKQQMQLVHMLK